MGYKLYASMGTGDYYTEHGIDVSRKTNNGFYVRAKFILCYKTRTGRRDFRNSFADKKKKIFL